MDPEAPAVTPLPATAKKRSLPQQQGYFLRQFRRCGRVAEAAARTGITPRTVQRWRANHPRFANRYDRIVEERISMMEDDLILRAGHVERRPILYRGNEVASVERHNTQLAMYVMNRLDRARHRAEDRAERRELAELQLAAENRMLERTAELVAQKLRNGS
ncbi:MAG: hypothetical protein Q8L22_30925 [Reyranella sp.]|nr:hypothetical protein [Reyranella sp.]